MYARAVTMSNKVKKVKAFYPKKKKKIPETKLISELRSRYDEIDETRITKFAELPLSSKTLKGLAENGYVEMTDIQRQSIGLALRGNDILGAAKTGSGKTLAFLVPVLETLYCEQWTRLDGLGGLIITPTRELAYQIYETLRRVGKHHDVSAGLIIGGKDLKFERKRVNQCNIVICTPGRLLQHMDENPLFDCVNMRILVLDEADRCLDMGFERTMNSIIENLPSERQTLLYSATQTKSIRDLARLSLKDPVYVSAHEHATHTTPEALRQSYIVCALEDKMPVLWSFLRNHLKQKIIVFLSSCKQVKYVYEVFCRLRPGVSLYALYGTLHQLRRMEIYETFCKKQCAVLFATDIAARGLDFPAVNWVVQMDCPEDVNAYIHRAGRTARFQRDGESLLVLLPSEEKMIEKLRERKIPISMIKINPKKLQSPQRKMEALLARDVSLKESAQRAFISYVKSVFLMRDKDVFNVRALNTDAFSRSLGLAVPPRIRFLQRIEQKQHRSNDDDDDDDDKNIRETRFVSNSSDLSKNDERKDITTEDRTLKRDGSEEEGEEKITSQTANDFVVDVDSDGDDILTVKRKNINLDDDESVTTTVIDAVNGNEESKGVNKKKAVTKTAVAKKILRKKIVPNKRITFNEEGEELLDPAKVKVSKLAKEYENEEGSGIDIEIAKRVLREEDKFDKQRFREKVKEKHREEKRRLKADKKQKTIGEDDRDEIVDSEDDHRDDRSDSEYSGPDLSWLPDPDKIYGRQRENDVDETLNAANSNPTLESADESEEDGEIHRPPKRKLVTQKEYKKKKQKTSSVTDDTDADLRADEELALQLLRR